MATPAKSTLFAFDGMHVTSYGGGIAFAVTDHYEGRTELFTGPEAQEFRIAWSCAESRAHGQAPNSLCPFVSRAAPIVRRPIDAWRVFKIWRSLSALPQCLDR